MIYSVLIRTFGGLSRPYFVRQLLFGLIFPVGIGFFFTLAHGTRFAAMPVNSVFLLVMNTLLYPYARFVYEGIVRYVVGNSWFFVPMLQLVYFKALTMAICWSLAIVIAPIGLVYLYFRSAKG